MGVDLTTHIAQAVGGSLGCFSLFARMHVMFSNMYVWGLCPSKCVSQCKAASPVSGLLAVHAL